MGVNSTNEEWFKYFRSRSYCTKNDSKNTFDCYCIFSLLKNLWTDAKNRMRPEFFKGKMFVKV